MDPNTRRYGRQICMPLDSDSVSLKKRFLIRILALVFLILLGSLPVQAIPRPLSEEELFKQSDLVVEGQVIKVYLYDQWLEHLKSQGSVLLKRVPGTATELVELMRNFPYRKAPVVIDGVYLAEVKVDKQFKGKGERVIFIPFAVYHFLPGRRLVGAWSERQYLEGERLKMYLRQNGPFFESTWWNGVKEVAPGPAQPE